MSRVTLLGFFFSTLSFFAFGQKPAASRDTVVLEGFISTDKTLTPNKVYKVNFNVKVSKNATLTVNPGTQVVFEPGTSLVLEGGLNAEGAPNNFIEFTSANPDAPGNGILIRGSSDGRDINIRYAVFRQLEVPLRFESEWYRKNVTIEKNVFTELYTGESNILITTPLVDYQPGADNSVNFSFSHNAFYDNWGSIFIENFEDNFMKLKFDNNLITNNVVYGIDIGIPSNTPVFGLFDDQKSDFRMQMQGNSIFGNYQINSATDTIIREISVGIQGEGEEFSIPNNFFRSKNPEYISSTFDHFYQNSSLPLLKAQPVLTKPQENVPPHIWKVHINGFEVENYDDLPRDIDPRNVTFDVYFNKPVTAFNQTQLEMVTFDTLAEKILKTPVTISQTRWSPDKTVFSFTASNASFIRDPYAFIEIANFKDAEGFLVPRFKIGQKNAINKYKGLEGVGVKSADLISAKKGSINVDVEGKAFLPTEKSVKTLETLSDLGVLKNLGPYRSLTKTWEIGLVAGVSNYFGTLTYKLVDQDEYHFSAGIFGQYNLNKWLSFRAMVWYGQISGSDIGDNDPDRAKRLLNFKNNIVEGSLTTHWHLLKYGTSRGEKFTPTIFAGVGIFRNAPMSRIFLYHNDKNEPVFLSYKEGQFFYDGTGSDVWVPLRPIGIEGQTVGGIDPEGFSNNPDTTIRNEFLKHEAPRQFRKVQVSFPIGVSLDYIIYNKWVVSVELGVRLTTTKYLDGHGGYYWDRGSQWDNNGNFLLDEYGLPLNAHQSIVDANPEIWGKVNGEKVLIRDPNLPGNRIGFADPNVKDVNNEPVYTEYNVAALIANPSLVNVDVGRGYPDPDPNNLQSSQNRNDAFTFNDARKANPKALDHFAFIGLKISKVIAKKDKKQRSRYKSKEKIRARDSDNDGVSDEEEKLLGTSSRNTDSDGDGLIDGEEVRLKTDPMKKDTDGDGLTDYKEANDLQTDALKKDSDNDGLEDGTEVNQYKTDPLEADTDKDGVNDGIEVNENKTDPLKP